MSKSYLKIGIKLIAIYLITAVLFKWAVGESFEYREKTISQYDVTSAIGPLTSGQEIYQELIPALDKLSAISVCLGAFGPDSQGTFDVEITNITDNINYPIFSVNIPATSEGLWYDIILPYEVDNILNKKVALKMICREQGMNALALYCNDSNNTLGTKLLVNQKDRDGELAYVLIGKEKRPAYAYYWIMTGTVGIILAMYLYYTHCCYKGNKSNALIEFDNLWECYNFLIRQLISRDFKNKYKRSVLGYLWSFLNPVATMVVQYAVFSTIFKSDIENFPVYLLAGTVFFSFFTEAVGQGLIAIVGNAALITKVYVPKYIYTVTKVYSCSINLVISLVPLLLLALITGTPLDPSIILLIVPIIAILIFATGISLLLSCSMVFFRDTQYLWGIVSLVWMYATPLFYPVSILPENVKTILMLNPLYYIVTFVRTILIEGKSPEPILYILCMIGPIISLIVGGLVFKKYQSKFILYI